MSKKRNPSPEIEIGTLSEMIDQIDNLATDAEEVWQEDLSKAMRYLETISTVCVAAQAMIEEIRVVLKQEEKPKAKAADLAAA